MTRLPPEFNALQVAREYRTKPSRRIVKLLSLGATVLLTIAWAVGSVSASIVDGCLPI
jgi:hypothetical protein